MSVSAATTACVDCDMYGCAVRACDTVSETVIRSPRGGLPAVRMRDIRLTYLFEFIRNFDTTYRRRYLNERGDETAASAVGVSLVGRAERASRAPPEWIRVGARLMKNWIDEVFQVTSAASAATVKSIEMSSRSTRVVASAVRKESDNAIGIVYGVRRACAVN